MRTRKDALEGKALPADFRLSPTRGRSGPRAAWGGEIGGPKISERVLNMTPSAAELRVSQNSTRLDSAATSASLSSTSIEIRCFDSLFYMFLTKGENLKLCSLASFNGLTTELVGIKLSLLALK